MHSIRGMRGIGLVAAFMLSATWVQAATLEVNQTSGPYTDIQSAIDDAATTGDTILITDSATYTTGTLRLTKQIKLMAEVGENPTIVDNRNDNDSGELFSIDDDDAAIINGFQIGSIEGGRINFHFDTTATSHTGPATTTDTPPRNYLLPRLNDYDDLTSFTLENLFVTQLKGDPDNTYRLHLVRDDGSDTRTVTINHVEVDDNNFEGGGDALLRINNAFAYITVNNSYFYNLDGNWAFYIRRGATLTINDTAVDARNMTGAAQMLVSFTDDIRTNTFNVNDSLLIGGPSGIIWRRSASTNWNFADSVFVSPNGGEIFRTASNDETDTMVVDHCDFIVINEDDGDYAVLESTDTGSVRDISIRNSNIILYANPTTGTTPVVNFEPQAGDTFVLEHNNVHGGNWGGGLYADGLNPVNSLILDPVYFNAQVGDVRYFDTTVKTGDDSGGPIGNDRALTDLVPVELSTFEVM